MLYAQEWYAIVEAEDPMRSDHIGILARKHKPPDGIAQIKRWDCVFKAGWRTPGIGRGVWWTR